MSCKVSPLSDSIGRKALVEVWVSDEYDVAAEFLRAQGYRIKGVSLDLFQPPDGILGYGLLGDGRHVRFFLPHDPAATPVLNVGAAA